MSSKNNSRRNLWITGKKLSGTLRGTVKLEVGSHNKNPGYKET